jgi:hypothetical protein
MTSLRPPLGEASGEHFGFETRTFRVAQVHLVEVASEQVGFFAPLGAADLDDHIAPVVGVLG